MHQTLFPTPLWSYALPEPLEATLLSREILRLRDQDPDGLRITNQGGWHSRSNLLDHGPLKGLFAWIVSCCQEAFTEVGWDFSLATPRFNNAWAMVNGPGHSVRAHLHPNSLFSGVVYLQAGPDSGSIAFLDPRNGAQALLPPLPPGDSGVLSGRVELEPRTGLLLLFPAWLWHEVGPNRSETERVCIVSTWGCLPPGPDRNRARPRPHPRHAEEAPLPEKPRKRK